MAENKKFKLKKNDNVKVIAGKDKGKTGRIVKVDRENDRVIVEGVNMVHKAQKKRRETDQAGIIEIEAPLHISNVMIMCKKCGATRVGYKVENGEKTRVCKKCGEAL